ncbi:cold-shock domain-containing protein [Clostridium baratii]|uniref:hypothetical protein n=1 Tax=Clostridium baratii TaxID=1561 RepID=UPI0006C1AA2A|nr:hypothetical protein [Clostridium baratii]CUP05422.1 cold-shock domain-containing protein [Clostridium baratii]
MEGRIKYINRQDGYGYIKTDNKTVKDVSFKLKDLPENVGVDDTVSFKTIKGSSRYFASNIKKVERNYSKYNTEDKSSWCKEGENLEEEFVKNIVPKLNRDIRINPEKKLNPCVIDLIDYDNNRFADLKSQRTPFFTVKNKNRGFDPGFTVTFNKKDYENYKINYPDCDIYWWVNWTQLSGYGVKVKPLNGVWVAKFSDMAYLIENNKSYLHEYDHRVNDDVNAKDSYFFDLRNDIFKKLL